MPAKTPGDRLKEIERSLFFIVGCGRSGTTLLQSILLAHPDIAIPPETKFASKYPAHTPLLTDLSEDASFTKAIDLAVEYERPKQIPFDEARFRELAACAPRTWDGILLALLAAVADFEGKIRVGEKSTDHTPFVGRLSESFPNAKFIHLLRDPRAVMLSRIRAGFTSGQLGTEIPRWKEASALHREQAERLGPKRYLLLRYEDLVTELEPTVRSLCMFLGIDMRPEMLTPHERSTVGFADRSKDWMDNTLKPVFTESVDRWRTELKQDQIALIEHVLRNDMLEMGYEPVGATTAAPGLRLAASAALGKAEYLRRKIKRGVRKLTRSNLDSHR
jgi:hypothetical protein